MANNKIAPHQTHKSTWTTKAGILLIIVALVIMQSSNAAAAGPGGNQQTNWSTITKVGIGGSVGALGLGGLICGLLTVGCPVGIAIAGGVLGAIGGTIALFPEPPAPTSPFPSGPSNWPDGPEPGDCASCNGSGGNGQVADDLQQPFRPPTGKVKVLMAMPGPGNSFATAAKKVARSFDWRQSAFDTIQNGMISRQHSGLFVGAPIQLPRGRFPVTRNPIQRITPVPVTVLPVPRPFLGRGK